MPVEVGVEQAGLDEEMGDDLELCLLRSEERPSAFHFLSSCPNQTFDDAQPQTMVSHAVRQGWRNEVAQTSTSLAHQRLLEAWSM